MRRVLIVSEANDWHLARLAEAAPRFGLGLTACPLRDCAFAIDGSGTGLHLPGFPETLPDAVLVRTVGSGTFEQVTLRLSLLHALAMLGVPVLNEARAIERCVDKGMTSFLLHRAGIATPPARVTESAELA